MCRNGEALPPSPRGGMRSTLPQGDCERTADRCCDAWQMSSGRAR